MKYDWQPISTAPKNGEWIWAYFPERQGKGAGKRKYITFRFPHMQRRIYWRTITDEDTYMDSWQKPHRRYHKTVGGFWVPDLKSKSYFYEDPTHWLPYPDLPKET